MNKSTSAWKNLMIRLGVVLEERPAPKPVRWAIEKIEERRVLNVAPTAIQFSNTTVAENFDTTGGVALGQLTTVDADVGDTFSYQITGGADAAVFTLAGVNNDILEIDAGVLDFEAQSSYSVDVEVTDSFSNTYTQTLTINVNDVNESPTDIQLSASTVNEIDTTGGFSVGTLTTSDQDTGETFTYSITGGADAGVFTIGGVNNDELILDDGVLDASVQASYAVDVQVTDSDGNTFTETLNVQVNNQVQSDTDLRVHLVRANSNNTVTVLYEIGDNDATAFDLSFVSSTDAQYDAGDSVLSTISITNAADLTVGFHAKTYTIGSGAGQITLPGLGASAIADVHYVLAVADAADVVVEGDAHATHEDNSAQLYGGFTNGAGGLYLYGGDNNTLTFEANNVHTIVNGQVADYANITRVNFQGYADGELDFSGFDDSHNLRVNAYFDSEAQVIVHGNTADETAALYSDHGSLVGGSHQLIWDGGNVVNVFANGGIDRALMYDSAGNDTFAATATYAIMNGDGHTNYVEGFDQNLAFSTQGGTDRAVFFDSAGNDTFVVTPTLAYMQMTGVLNQASGFDSARAQASAGNDLAYMHDSAGDDTFVAAANFGSMYGTGFNLHAAGFDAVRGYSTAGGTDSAYLHDTTGDDQFRIFNDLVLMNSINFASLASAFANVTLVGTTGGTDTIQDNRVSPSVTFNHVGTFLV